VSLLFTPFDFFADDAAQPLFGQDVFGNKVVPALPVTPIHKSDFDQIAACKINLHIAELAFHRFASIATLTAH
jgi:hypothetical protein